MEYAITDLIEPMRFGQSMMYRLFHRGPEATNEKAKFTGGDYRDLCYKLERLINDVKHRRELWKDRFFFQAMEAEDHELCNGCKEGMRQALYVNGDEFEALRWRPGLKKNGECGQGDCEQYCCESIEDLDLIRPIMTRFLLNQSG